MRRILHVSDTHGTFPPLPEGGDVIVHSGDLMPNKTRGDREVEPGYQANWLVHKREHFRRWLDGRPMLLCRGNHDFTPRVEPILRGAGLDVTDITNRTHHRFGLTFHGFPYVNRMDDEWNFEVGSPEMSDKVAAIPWGCFDVLVAHAPIAGLLDQNGQERCGNGAMAHALSYIVPRENWPRAYLCGHIHEGNGIADLDGMIVSNAATVVWDLRIDVGVRSAPAASSAPTSRG